MDSAHANITSQTVAAHDSGQLELRVEPHRAVAHDDRPYARGKFLFVGQQKLFVRGVTYGPFRPGPDGDPVHPYVTGSWLGAGPDAPTVLLLHGWTATADLNWFTAYEALGRTFLDLPESQQLAGSTDMANVSLAMPTIHPMLAACSVNPTQPNWSSTTEPAIIPVAMVFLGIGDALKVFVIFFACLFPILVNTIDGVRAADPVLVRTALTFRVSRFATIWKVILPIAAPTIMTGLRIATAIALILTVISEMIGATSGIGRLIKVLDASGTRVGVVGLGTGTLAVYGRKGDVYRFYEINPQVVEVASRDFSFLGDSGAKIEHVLGDARLAMEREAPQNYDVLAIDAFSSDSIPVHLITREAMAVYLRHVKPGGVVAFHVTNRFLHLAPVVKRIAAEYGLHVALIEDDAEDSDLARTDWVLVTRDAKLLAREDLGTPGKIEDIRGLRVWTDDFNNLFRILK